MGELFLDVKSHQHPEIRDSPLLQPSLVCSASLLALVHTHGCYGLAQNHPAPDPATRMPQGTVALTNLTHPQLWLS